MRFGKYETHPAADVFPMLEEAELAALADDIRANGLQQAVVLSKDGRILDGRNRMAACLIAHVLPRFETYQGDSDTEYAISINLHRRHLTSSQRAAVAVEILPLLEQEARGRMVAGKRDPEERVPQGERAPMARDIAAEKTGSNPHYVSDAKKIAETDPVAFDAIKRGEKTIPQVKREQREQKREGRRQENAAVVARVTEPSKLVGSARFATISIDPPWDWGDEGDGNQLGRAKPDYATMSMDQLLGLPVGELADEDCHLYLWITNRSLPKGFALMERWGFRYITAITWVKPSFGMGNYFRGQTEHVLFGVRGSQMLKRKDVGTYFSAERGSGGHSSKPDYFYSLVESCSPGPYLEMFSRSSRPKWTHWGQDARAA